MKILLVISVNKMSLRNKVFLFVILAFILVGGAIFFDGGAADETKDSIKKASAQSQCTVNDPVWRYGSYVDGGQRSQPVGCQSGEVLISGGYTFESPQVDSQILAADEALVDTYFGGVNAVRCSTTQCTSWSEIHRHRPAALCLAVPVAVTTTWRYGEYAGAGQVAGPATCQSGEIRIEGGYTLQSPGSEAQTTSDGEALVESYSGGVNSVRCGANFCSSSYENLVHRPAVLCMPIPTNAIGSWRFGAVAGPGQTSGPVSCQPGEVRIEGGYRIENPTIDIQQTLPAGALVDSYFGGVNSIRCSGTACTSWNETLNHIPASRCVSHELFCVDPTCGDGNLDAGEDCDDGNNVTGDGCNGDCTRPDNCNDVCVEATGCGGGYSCTGGFCRTQTCDTETDCICPTCGDGNLDLGEDCDDGNNDEGDGCSADCKKPNNCNEFCTAGIGCDGGLTCESGNCRNVNCTTESDCNCAACGDGSVDIGEACDDGNTINGDGCDAGCRVETKVTPVAPTTGAGLSVAIAVLIAGALGGLGYFGYQKGWWKGLIGK